jgi:hypothetical protein
MKTKAMGDVILQVGSDRSPAPTMKVSGRSCAEGTFDNLVISEFGITKPATGDYFVEAHDVDGTQSGLIMVVGDGRRSDDSPSVQFFTTGGVATTTNLFYLKDYDSSFVAGQKYPRGAALFKTVAAGGTIICFQ